MRESSSARGESLRAASGSSSNRQEASLSEQAREGCLRRMQQSRSRRKQPVFPASATRVGSGEAQPPKEAREACSCQSCASGTKGRISYVDHCPRHSDRLGFDRSDSWSFLGTSVYHRQRCRQRKEADMKTDICPCCRKSCEWNKMISWYICKPCGIWFRFSADGKTLDLSGLSDNWGRHGGHGARAYQGSFPRLARWWYRGTAWLRLLPIMMFTPLIIAGLSPA
jgi:hypothetical protein